MLVFADRERFHPLSVEAYLSRCDLYRRPAAPRPWPRRAVRVTGGWDEQSGVKGDAPPADRGAARAASLGGFDAGHYLRFLDPAVWRARRAAEAREGTQAAVPWAGFAILQIALASWWWLGPRSWQAPLGKGLLIAMAVILAVSLYGWLEQRFGSDRAGAVVLAAATAMALGLVYWTWQDEAGWRRWGSRALAAVLLFGALQRWSDRSLSHRAAIGLKSLSVAPIVLAVVWGVASLLWGRVAAGWIAGIAAVVTLLALFDDLMAAYMAVFSSLRREASAQAAAVEQEWRERAETGSHPYYGRVWRDPEDRWIVLQYFFFYAFNDWRSHAGLNFHEADWEWAAVFLERQDGSLVPREVALSQHHSIGLRAWAEVEKAEESHPVLYVAMGSHANYFEAGSRRLPDLIGIVWLKKLVQALLDSRQKSEQAAAEGRSRYRSWIGRQVGERSERRSTADDASGDGLVIGPALSPSMPPDRRRAGWRPVLLDGSQPWVDYRGLWGVRARLRNESGPPGPKWERAENLPWRERAAGRRRRWWRDPLVLRSRDR